VLVLSRKAGESIDIGGDIRVIVLQQKGDKVSIGIEAPRVIPVYRSEVSARRDELEQRREEGARG